MKDGSKYEFCRAAIFGEKKKDKPLIVITLKIVLPGFFLVCQTIMHDAKLI